MSSAQDDAAAKQFEAVANMAAIYVYRDEPTEQYDHMPVMLDGAWMADVPAKTFIRLLALPGTRTIASDDDRQPPAVLEAEAGGVYYVRLTSHVGLIGIFGRVEETEAEEAQPAIEGTQLAAVLGY